VAELPLVAYLLQAPTIRHPMGCSWRAPDHTHESEAPMTQHWLEDLRSSVESFNSDTGNLLEALAASARPCRRTRRLRRVPDEVSQEAPAAI